MANPSQETQIALLIQRQIELERHLAESDKELAAFKASYDAERTRFFVWGISVLGAGLVGMVGIFYNFFTGGHYK